MNLSETNRHLNIFNYYDYSKSHDPKENNLSRALAISLNYNDEFLSKVFRYLVLDSPYKNMFSLDFDEIEEEDVYIDIQTTSGSKKITERKYENYIGVLLANFDSDINQKEIKEMTPASTSNPIPDILVGIKNTLIVIENKIGGGEYDFAQLKGHVKSIIDNNHEDKEDIEEVYKHVKWPEVIKLAMKVKNNSNGSNVFVGNLLDFVMRKHTDLMPVLTFSEIKIDETGIDKESQAVEMINQRLEILKVLTLQKGKFSEDELLELGGNKSIPLDVKWAKLANLGFDVDAESIKVQLWPGDTKGQGKKIYEKNEVPEWHKKKVLEVSDKEYDLDIKPYVKISNWNRGIAWIKESIRSDNKFYNTHNYEGFKEIAGRWKRNDEKDEWKELENILDEKIGKQWRNEINWQEKFINSGKTTIDLSLGFSVSASIPFELAQKLDDKKEDSKLVEEINRIIEGLEDMIDN